MKPRNDALQGLRAAAALLVFLNHFGGVFSAQFAIAAWVTRCFASLNYLCLGSSTFVVIASYFTYRAFDENRAARHGAFLKRRLLKIMPLYWLVLAVYVLVSLALKAHHKVPADFGPFVLTVLSNVLLLAPLEGRGAIILVSWTLTYIVLAYLTIPPFAAIGRRIGTRPSVRAGSVIAFGAVWHVLGWRCAPMITAGMLLWECQKSERFRRFERWLGDAGSTAVLVAGIALQLASAGRNVVVSMVGGVVFSAGIALFSSARLSPGGVLNAWFAKPAPQWLGKISYSYYLGHGMVLFVIKNAVRARLGGVEGSAGLFWCCLGGSLAASLCFSAALHRCSESIGSLSSVRFRLRRPVSASGGLAELCAILAAGDIPQPNGAPAHVRTHGPAIAKSRAARAGSGS